MQHTVLVVLFSAVAVYGIPPLFQDWNGLYATWSINPFKAFGALPRKLSDNKEFVLKDNQCDGGKFFGQRYWANNDGALVLLYDKNGIIAGMQTSSPKSQFTPSQGMKGFVDDGDFWTQTAYFVDPSTVCTTGRTAADLDKQGTGTGLWLQTGPDPTKDINNIPLYEGEIKQTLWGSGRCFPTMGQHYWYNVTSDMNCNNFFPTCLLYNNGKLTAFCFAKNGYLESPRYDFPHPTNEKVKGFMNPVPKCFNTDKSFARLSTLHVYFHSNPLLTTTC